MDKSRPSKPHTHPRAITESHIAPVKRAEDFVRPLGSTLTVGEGKDPPARASWTPCEPLSKLLVSPLISPIVLPYIIPHITPFKEFRL